jgi:hypothetical protein
MALTQISVRLPDKPGELVKFTQMLHNNKFKILSITVSQIPGLCLFIIDRPEECISILKNKNYDADIKEVIGVLLPHNPSSSVEIEKVAKILGDNEVNIDFLYSSFIKKTNVMIIHVSDIEKAKKALLSNGVYLYKKSYS